MTASKNTMCIQLKLDDIQRDLLSYLNQVENGMILQILKAGKPMAEITPVTSSKKGLRPFGLCAGEFTVPNDFDDPLPEDIIQDFEEK